LGQRDVLDALADRPAVGIGPELVLRLAQAVRGGDEGVARALQSIDDHRCSLRDTPVFRVTRHPVVWPDRMPLHPKVQALLTAQRLSGAPPMHTLSPEKARADMRAQVRAVSGPLATVARVEDRHAPGPSGE